MRYIGYESILGKVSLKSILKILSARYFLKVSYLSIFEILFQNIFIEYLQDAFEKYLAQHCRLATTYMSRKLGHCAPLGAGELSPHPAQCIQGRGLPPCEVLS